MYLLYLDESGNESDAADRYFVLGGLALFERQTYWLSKALDDIQARHFPGVPPIVFHATELRGGKGFWRRVTPEVRRQVLGEWVEAITTATQGAVCFSAAVEKTDTVHGERAVELATEEVCRRFDIFLQRKYHDEQQAQRGLLIFAEGRFHKRARLWVQNFRTLGTRWNVLRNLADIPYFASTKETRLLQAADIIAHAVFLAYERNDRSLIRPMLRCFDADDRGVIHGLKHVRAAQRTDICTCPACRSRANPGDYGPWANTP